MKRLKVLMIFAFMLCLSNGSTHASSEENLACTLTISGYGNVEGVGRIPITLSATAETCEEAGAQLRPSIIEMEIRLYE